MDAEEREFVDETHEIGVEIGDRVTHASACTLDQPMRVRLTPRRADEARPGARG